MAQGLTFGCWHLCRHLSATGPPRRRTLYLLMDYWEMRGGWWLVIEKKERKGRWRIDAYQPGFIHNHAGQQLSLAYTAGSRRHGVIQKNWSYIPPVAYVFQILIMHGKLQERLNFVNFAGRWGDWTSWAPSWDCTVKLSSTWFGCRGLRCSQKEWLIPVLLLAIQT